MEVYCTTNNTEVVILFWTLVIAALSFVVATIFSLIERCQCTKINSINILKESLETPFNEYLVKDFSQRVIACKYVFANADVHADNVQVAFDTYPLLELREAISNYTGSIAHLSYAIPKKFKKLNSLSNDLIDYIDNEMCAFAYYTEAPKRRDGEGNKTYTVKEAQVIYNTMCKKLRKFYKKAFKIYKYGL